MTAMIAIGKMDPPCTRIPRPPERFASFAALRVEDEPATRWEAIGPTGQPAVVPIASPRVAGSSSTRKAAKLANRSGGRSVRMQSGSIFPIAIMAVIVLGVASIVYSRQTVPSADDSPPTINDHWHMAYGFNICGEWYQLEGDLEDRNAAGNFVNTKFLQTGIHSHNDGVIHWHPYTSRAVGSRADLGVFLETYEVELTNDALRFPDSQFDGADYVEGETTCNGEDAELSVVVWENFTDTDDGDRYIADMNDIRVSSDQMVFSIAFVPRGEPVSMPPWASRLPELGAIDAGVVIPDEVTQSTIAGDNGD